MCLIDCLAYDRVGCFFSRSPISSISAGTCVEGIKEKKSQIFRNHYRTGSQGALLEAQAGEIVHR
jgi:hypothetical protein